MEVYEYPGYRCGPCPPGLQGNGTHCEDINEVRGEVPWGYKESGESRAEGFRGGRDQPRQAGGRGHRLDGKGTERRSCRRGRDA